MKIQSNLCTTTTLGTPKKWPLCRGGRYTEGDQIFINEFINNFSMLGIRPGRCWQVVVVQRWSLTQVWLYFETIFFFANHSSDEPIKWIVFSNFFKQIVHPNCEVLLKDAFLLMSFNEFGLYLIKFHSNKIL